MLFPFMNEARRARDAHEPPPHAAHLPLEAAIRRVGDVVRGKTEAARLSMISLLAGGHLLLEDVPGVGKTTLARALARVIGGQFARVQLTADLLPADIVGGPILEAESGGLKFRRGPIFANVVLADELNRATPRTQSGLLEAMAERAVSVDGATHPLPAPFFVIATQNPSEHHGTYVLPQSQMDRFLLRTALGYPEADVERALLTGAQRSVDLEDLVPVLDTEAVLDLQTAVDEVVLSEPVANYLQGIVAITREDAGLETGVSTRGMLLYARAARARALMQGRTYVSPEDVYELALPVCSHRVVLRGHDRPSRRDAESLMQNLLERVPVPV